MRNSKLPIVLIGVLALVLIAIIIFAFSFLGGDGKSGDGKDKTSSENLISPIIELNLNTTEPDQEKVTIEVVATTEDKDGIDYIELPDGTQIFADNKEYEVTENGKYEFKVYGVNGAKSKLSIEVKNIRAVSASNPYMPEGFEYVSGEIDTGYTIRDKYGNQYVWVPVESGILIRTTNTNGEYEESNSYATGLVNSVAKNFGFYIAKYEASAYQANDVRFAGSVEGQTPWTNVAYQDAMNAATNTASALQYPEDIITALPSSYAWDTVLNWIDKTVTNYSTNTSYGNYSGTVLPTGGTDSDIVKGICDLAGNVREWTTEVYKDNTTKKAKTSEMEINRVVRGGSAYINKVANSRNGYPESLTDEYWGFRTVLYKNS